MERYPLVIFDLDGTLFDSEDEAWRALTTTPAPELRFIDTKKKMMQLYCGNFYEEVCKANHIPVRKVGSLEKRLRRAFIGDYAPHVFGGMKSLVMDLEHNHTLVIVSSNFNKTINRLLHHAKMSSKFAIVSGADNEPDKTARIKAVLKKTKTAAKNAVFITDTTGDVKDAKKAGVKSIGVAWGFHSPSMLKKAGAIAIAKRPKDILRIIHRG